MTKEQESGSRAAPKRLPSPPPKTTDNSLPPLTTSYSMPTKPTPGQYTFSLAPTTKSAKPPATTYHAAATSHPEYKGQRRPKDFFNGKKQKVEMKNHGPLAASTAFAMDPLDTESNASFSNPTTGLPDLSFDSLNEILNEPEIQDPLEQRIKKAEKDIGEGLSKSVIIMTNQRDRISDLEQRLHESNEKIENQSKELSELKTEMTAIKETMKNLLQQSKNRKPPARATKPTGAPAGKQHFHKEPESNRY